MKRILIIAFVLLSALAKAQTIGIKVAAPIIKNSPSDNTVTGYANLLNGGYHTVTTIAGRDSLVSAYSKTLNTGMIAYVSGVDSTYRWSGSAWSNVSLSNYAQLQDGLVSGGDATIGTGSVTIAIANYRINKINYTSASRTFTGIANSPSGTQYYLVVYAKTSSTLDTISGARANIAVVPSNPVNTIRINTILVGSGGVVSSAPDLSGYAKLNGGNNFSGNQYADIFLAKQSLRLLRTDGGGVNSGLLIIGSTPTGDVIYRVINDAGNFSSVLTIGREAGIFDFKQTPSINGVPIGTGAGTVTSVATGYGLTGGTINTSGTLLADTTSATALVSKSRLTSALTAKQNAIILTTTGTSGASTLIGSTLNVPQYAGTTYTFGTGLTNTANNITVDTTNIRTVANSRTLAQTQTSLNLKANLASPTFTGSVTAPTFVGALTGNASTASTSTLWSGEAFLGIELSTSPFYFMGFQASDSKWHPTTMAVAKQALGLGSNAYTSTAYLPLTGGTLTGKLILPSGTISSSPLRIPSGVAPTTPIDGDIWRLTGRTQIYDGTQTKDVLFDKANSTLSGFGVGAVVTDNLGNLSVAPSADRVVSGVITKTSAYTVTLSDVGSNGTVLVRGDATSATFTITLPVASTTTGLTFIIKKTDSSANGVTVSVASTIDGTSTKVFNTQYSGASIMSNGTSYNIVATF